MHFDFLCLSSKVLLYLCKPSFPTCIEYCCHGWDISPNYYLYMLNKLETFFRFETFLSPFLDFIRMSMSTISFLVTLASFPLTEFYKILYGITYILFIKILNALQAYNFVMLLLPASIIHPVWILHPFLLPSLICRNHKTFIYSKNSPPYMSVLQISRRLWRLSILHYFRVDPIMFCKNFKSIQW